MKIGVNRGYNFFLRILIIIPREISRYTIISNKVWPEDNLAVEI